MKHKLTIGMSTYADYDGVFFTLHALALYCAKEVTGNIQYVVIDNMPISDASVADQCGKFGAKYVHMPSPQGTAVPRNRIFSDALGEIVLSLDCHVLLVPGALQAVIEFFDARPGCKDMVQGPLLHDDHKRIATHMSPEWSDRMFGTWACDPRGQLNAPFEIPMQGMGMFAMRREAWPGFNPKFRGFGGEEGYIHEKVRKAGGKCWCLPAAKWVHRFKAREKPTAYPNLVEDRVFNYYVGWKELGLNTGEMLEHFQAKGDTVAIAKAMKMAADLPSDDEPEVVVMSPAPATRAMTATVNGPLVSCLCPTYAKAGTPHQYLLEEAIECFLRQTYESCELIVMNDCPEQRLIFDHPRVTIVNLNRRFRTLGEKRNALNGLAAGDILLPWDDDDIHLPKRIEMSAAGLLNGKADYFNPRGYWFIQNEKLISNHTMGYCMNASAFTRHAMDSLSGYRHVSGSEDALLSGDLRSSHLRDGNTEKSTPDRWFYIYRFGVANHLSATPDIAARYEALSKVPVKTGDIVLKPFWRRDYAADIAKALEAK